MEIFEILKESIKYPFSDIQTFLIIGVIFLAITVLNSIGGFTDNSTIGLIGTIVAFIISILIAGYQLDILKFGIELNDELPSIDPEKNLKNGLKLVIVEIVYYIIPIIVTFFAMFLFGGIIGAKIYNAQLTVNSTETEIINSIFTADVIGSVIVIAIIAFIIFLIFSLLALMGQSRLAKSGSIDEAISFGQSYRDLKEIGIGKTLALLILLYILIFVLLFIFAFVSLIPYVGFIIFSLVCPAFIAFMTYRAYGLLYSEIA